MSGEFEKGKVPDKLTLDSDQVLAFIPHDDVHTKVLRHAQGLSTVSLVWLVKHTNNRVVPCGAGVIVTKQIVCTPGPLVVS